MTDHGAPISCLDPAGRAAIGARRKDLLSTLRRRFAVSLMVYARAGQSQPERTLALCVPNPRAQILLREV